MMPFQEAIRNIHFPESVDKLRKAQLRLKFDELFFIQLNILRTANLRKRKLKGIVFPSVVMRLILSIKNICLFN